MGTRCNVLMYRRLGQPMIASRTRATRDSLALCATAFNVSPRTQSLRQRLQYMARDQLAKLRKQERPRTRVEWENALVHHGYLNHGQGLEDAPETARSVFFSWQHTEDVACKFARLIAASPQKYGIGTDVVADRVTPENAANAACRVDETAVSSIGQEEGLAVVLPGLTEPHALVALCRELDKRNGWRVDASFNPSDKLARYYVRVTLIIGPAVEAEILGFGPFDFLPRTRFAPVSALWLRTKADGAKSRGGEPNAKAHLADMVWPRSEGRESQRFHNFWDETEKKREEVLGGQDSAARARITFAIPSRYWEGR